MTMASSNTTPKILALATKISAAAKELQDQLASQGLQSPNWDEESPLSLPDNVSHLRDDVLDATSELHEQLLEPLILINSFLALPNVASIDAITRYHIADMIPPGGRVSFQKIAERSGHV